MADTRTPASRRATPTTGASRLPSARERRPALAALAVLLIVGGAFASGFLALQAGNRADYLRIKEEVPQGAEITEDDLETVSLPEDMDGVISADNRDDVVGTYAVTLLLPGTILTENMVDDDAGVPEGKTKLTIGVEADSLSIDLRAGAAVQLIAASDEGDDVDVYDGEVVTVYRPEEDGGVGGTGAAAKAQVQVLVDEQDARALTPALQDDRVTIGEVAPPDSGDGSGSEGGE